ncbi:MAG: DUF4418 family protein [Treponema sp.]|nr:DUF4418 family protein [Treponema sp.]
MKFSVLSTISGIAVVVFGLFIIFGPKFFLNICPTGADASGCGSGGCGGDVSEIVMIEDVDADGCGDGGCGTEAVMDLPRCHYSAQALIGIGILITALGLCMIVFENMLIQFGLSIGVFFASIIALLIPNGLVGMCFSEDAVCRVIALPVITTLSIILLAASAAYTTFLYFKKPE